MIMLWMLYALAIALWLTLAGLLAERALRALGRSARLLWFAVLICSALVPLVMALLAASAPQSAEASFSAAGAGWRTLIDRLLVAGWVGSGFGVAATVLLSGGALQRARRHWRPAQVQGTTVFVAPDLGPGVVMLGRAQIVLPAWALELDAARLDLMVRHEHEHMRARDHWLIMGALVVLLLCAFNPVLWWQFKRLKLAIEMDCDARVLSGRQNVREYAALLLDVGARSRAARLLFAAFATPPHAIERRIRTMLEPRSKTRRTTLALGAAGVVVCTVLACETPEPSSPEPALRSVLGSEKEEAPPPPHPPEAPPRPAERLYEKIIDPNATTGSEKPLDIEVVIDPNATTGARKLQDRERLEYKVTYDEVRLKPPPPPPPPPRKGTP